MIDCPYADGWVNREGWLIINGKLVCGDWDDYCTKCRIDNTQDYVIAFNEETDRSE